MTSADMVEIQFSQPSFKYRAGDGLFLQAPFTLTRQWHPFPITSCPYDPYLSIHVPLLRGFNTALANSLGAGPLSTGLQEDLVGQYELALVKGQQLPVLFVNGPYSVSGPNVFDEERAILIAEGIGITAMASILKHIWHHREMGPAKTTRGLRHVDLYWACEDINSFEWFRTLFSALEVQMDGIERTPEVHIHTYLTRDFELDDIHNIVVHSVGADVDALTGLKSLTNFGRPNFRQILTGMRDEILEENEREGISSRSRTKIGVYFSGSSDLRTSSTSGMLAYRQDFL
jgi:NADPH oxidase 1